MSKMLSMARCARPQKLKAEDVKTRRSCETSLKIWKWKMWKRSFRARPSSKTESWRCENEAFARDLPQNLKVEDVKTKLSRETSLKNSKLKMWNEAKSESGRCENEAFVRDLPQNWKLQMWKRSFRARPPSKSERGRCEDEAFARDPPQNLKVEDVKTRLSRETSLQIWKWKVWKRGFRARHPSKLKAANVKTKLLLWHLFARTTLCSDIPLLWHPLALTSLCSDIPLHWRPFALTSLCFDISLLWHLFALTSLFCDILKIRTTEVRPSNFLWQHLTPAVAKPSLAWLRIDGSYTITRRIQGTKMGQSPLLGYRAKSRTQIMLRQEVLITSLCMGLRGTM